MRISLVTLLIYNKLFCVSFPEWTLYNSEDKVKKSKIKGASWTQEGIMRST